jgi:phosphoribosylglycinamide formyltransferase-1
VTTRIAVFASGAGSNLEALLRHFGAGGAARSASAAIALLVSNRSTAGALGVATRHHVPTGVITDPTDAVAIHDLLARSEIDLIALAGYLKAIPSSVTDTFRGRTLNVHPALLPAFGGRGMYGQRVHRAVLEAGARVTGVTVHFVDAVYDRGPIIAQWPVQVRSDDSPETLAARVLRVEHTLYPRVVEAVADGRVLLDDDGRVRSHAFDAADTAQFTLQPEGVTTCT